jgi:hypothetical protein
MKNLIGFLEEKNWRKLLYTKLNWISSVGGIIEVASDKNRDKKRSYSLHFEELEEGDKVTPATPGLIKKLGSLKLQIKGGKLLAGN